MLENEALAKAFGLMLAAGVSSWQQTPRPVPCRKRKQAAKTKELISNCFRRRILHLSARRLYAAKRDRKQEIATAPSMAMDATAGTTNTKEQKEDSLSKIESFCTS